jgi:hypothetical protein
MRKTALLLLLMAALLVFVPARTVAGAVEEWIEDCTSSCTEPSICATEFLGGSGATLCSLCPLTAEIPAVPGHWKVDSFFGVDRLPGFSYEAQVKTVPMIATYNNV